jgi:citrate lyase subunit beta / citryl-CoA lyase
MMAKAAGLECDEVFLDLEDAVAPNEKTDQTRQAIVTALTQHEWRAQTRVVRVNAVNTPWCLRDILYIVERAANNLDCIMLPKVERAADIHFADQLLACLEQESDVRRPIGIEVQIETARGLANIDAVAAASGRIETLIFGPGDFASSIGMPQLSVGAIEGEYPGDHWHYVLWRILTTARAHGLQAIDGPYARIDDPQGFGQVARRSALLGFDGKWAIHPSQIEPCNAIFAPTATQFDHAIALLARYEQAVTESGRGAVLHEGEMIDEASRRMAEQLVARGRAVGLG